MLPKVGECDLRILPFNSNALTFWKAIRHFEAVDPRGGFDWEDIRRLYYKLPRRFDVAIWDGEILCGLASGKASRHTENVTVCFMERFPIGESRLKGLVAETVVTAAESYAKIISRQWVRIKDPLPGTEVLYENLQFSLAPRRFGVTYYQRPVA
jgi:hypothetical protein